MRSKVCLPGVSEALGQPRGAVDNTRFSSQLLSAESACPRPALWVTVKFLKQSIQNKSAFLCCDSAVDLRKPRAPNLSACLSKRPFSGLFRLQTVFGNNLMGRLRRPLVIKWSWIVHHSALNDGRWAVWSVQVWWVCSAKCNGTPSKLKGTRSVPHRESIPDDELQKSRSSRLDVDAQRNAVMRPPLPLTQHVKASELLHACPLQPKHTNTGQITCSQSHDTGRRRTRCGGRLPPGAPPRRTLAHSQFKVKDNAFI